MLNSSSKNALLSLLAGAVFYYFLAYFWAYFPSVNPVFNGLLSCCAGREWLKPAIHLHDILINTVLGVPLAIFLLKLNPKKVWIHIAYALLSMFVIGRYHLVLPDYWGSNLSIFVLPTLIELVPLPLAMMALRLYGQQSLTA